MKNDIPICVFRKSELMLACFLFENVYCIYWIINKVNMISEENQKQALKDFPNLSTSKEINELRALVDKSVKENDKILREICAQDPTFLHHSYAPKVHLGANPVFLKPLLLKQIDQLFEEKDLLIRKKEEIQFRKKEILDNQEVELKKNIGHYATLRLAWTKFNKEEAFSAQKIDNLNKIVGMVKNNIRLLTREENQAIQEELRSNSNHFSAKQLKLQQKNRQKMERIMMENQELKCKYLQILSRNSEKQQKIKHLQQQLCSAGQQIKKCLQALQKTTEKIKHLQQSKKTLEEKVNKLQSHVPAVVCESQFQNFSIKISSSSIHSHKEMKTCRKLQELFHFLQDEKITKTDHQLTQNCSESFIPSLNLDQTGEKSFFRGLTERLQPTNTQKFIPMRTQRAQLNKSTNMRTTNVSEGGGSCCSRQKIQNMTESSKKFFRKGELPLTTGRRNSRMGFLKKNQEDEKIQQAFF